MVTDYNLQCSYQIGTLKDKIFLLPYDETTSINYKIDNNKINVTGINYQSCYTVEGINVILNETESYDNRFKFATTVSISIKEELYKDNLDAFNKLRNKKWFVIVENYNNNQFIATVDFPLMFEYNYSFTTSNEESHTNTLTFTGLSNIPVMILDNPLTNINIFGLISKSCFYNIGNIKDLKLCNFKNTLIKKNVNGYEFDNIFVNGGETYHTVEFIKNTFSFTEQYKNNKFTSTLTFSIPLSDYKYIFHYNLIEFKKNRYTVVFRTDNGNVFAAGFEYGFFPSYTIQTSEEVNTLNTITITLKHEGDMPLFMSRKNDSDIYIVDERITFVPKKQITKPNGDVISTEICINETQAIRTLLNEQTVTGEETDRYWCLKGYEDMYSFLNIVGTYTEEDDFGIQLIINSNKCSKESETECNFELNPPSSITLYVQDQQVQFQLKGTCDWTVTKFPTFVMVNPMQGIANDSVTVTVTARVNPSENGEQGVIEIISGNKKYETQVNLVPLGDWISPDIFNITAQKQVVSCFTTLSSSNIELVNTDGCVVSFQGNTVNITVPENPNEYPRTKTITVKNRLTGIQKQILINQDKLYTEWRWLSNDDIICNGIISYQKLTKFKGYTSTTVNIQTSETKQGDKVLDNDSRCYVEKIEWRATTETMCDGSNLYYVEEEWKSIDGGLTFTATGKTRKGNLVETNSPTCDNRYSWVDNNETICVNGNLYQKLEKYFNNGTSLVPTGDVKTGKLLEVQSPSCLNPELNIIKYTFWYHNISTTQPLTNLKIQASTDFTINWGDGTSSNYLASDYEILNVCSHIWTKATPASGDSWHEYTVQISGGIYNLYLDKPDISKTTDFYYAAIDVEKGTELRYIYMNTTRLKDNSINLSACEKLISFQMINNYDTKGLTSFTYPTYSMMEYLKIGNESFNIRSYINTGQLQTIVDNLPTYSNDKHGIIDLCYNPDDNGTEYGCGIDETPINTKQWHKSNECCRVDGSKNYRLIETGDFICDTENHIKYAEMKLQYCTYNASTGYWSAWQDVTPIELYYGDILEIDSTDCGGGSQENIKWELRTDLYECDGFDSYYQEQKFVSTDGVNYNPAVPEEFRRGKLKLKNDPLCGYVPPILPLYRYDTVLGDYICGDEYTSPEIPSQTGNFKMTLFKPTTITIPFDGNAMIVDWGDGTINTGTNTHTYTSEQIYTIQVKGVINQMGSIGEISNRLNFQNTLIRIDSWGSPDTIQIVPSNLSIAGSFSGCNQLAICADDTYGVLNGLKVFYAVFSGCYTLYGNSLRILGKEVYDIDGVNVDTMYCRCTELSNYDYLNKNHNNMVIC